MSIAYGNVTFEDVIGAAAYEYAGETTGRDSNVRDCGARAVLEPETKTAKLFYQPRSADLNAGLSVDIDPVLPTSSSAAAPDLRVGLPGYGEAVQTQRDMRRADSNTRSANEGADDIVHKLAVARDSQCRGDRTADVTRMSTLRARTNCD